ncbi:hypothetical protein M409DRAFT_21051 [Zasmidium cellare ATCC 36951]|uniref:Conidiation-specific protein 8 n=1 Tax=Zasmidium cellare ATCC 36951 TaxID=1080233 RepID=A0A6A6CT77_ZASCE|nr:uncharacterized protein M409DRAFT_21051 [Zasmidium cellare ATCC 36951]KAF2169042.1 hypothetical protein M409DRAFT_21051 [Zasmidium cellare ATCC 36951]
MSSSSDSTTTPANTINREKSSSLDVGHKKGPTALFSGMQEYKRDSTTASEQRRSSLEDMSAKPQGGVLANMWNSTFKGGSAK